MTTKRFILGETILSADVQATTTKLRDLGVEVSS